MKSKAEQIYKAVVEGDSYKGSKKECIKIIEKIINSDNDISQMAFDCNNKKMMPTCIPCRGWCGDKRCLKEISA